MNPFFWKKNKNSTIDEEKLSESIAIIELEQELSEDMSSSNYSKANSGKPDAKTTVQGLEQQLAKESGVEYTMFERVYYGLSDNVNHVKMLMERNPVESKLILIAATVGTAYIIMKKSEYARSWVGYVLGYGSEVFRNLTGIKSEPVTVQIPFTLFDFLRNFTVKIYFCNRPFTVLEVHQVQKADKTRKMQSPSLWMLFSAVQDGEASLVSNLLKQEKSALSKQKHAWMENEKGLDPNYRSFDIFFTQREQPVAQQFLHLAATKGFSDVCEILIEYGANPSSPCEKVKLILLPGTKHQHGKYSQPISYDTDSSSSESEPEEDYENFGYSEPPLPIDSMAKYTQTKTLNSNVPALLTQNNFYLDAWHAGTTPLHCAAAVGCAQICKFLLQVYKVDPNIGDEVGMTALHLSILHSKDGVIDTVRLLISNGASVQKEDATGKTAYDYLQHVPPRRRPHLLKLMQREERLWNRWVFQIVRRTKNNLTECIPEEIVSLIGNWIAPFLGTSDSSL
ncbi:hypothetical protein HK098_006328 [Nowakowskiella sp. JEL0407]|nr:hypothetical protein HK098_006328 [Nowakowskiella sp. JEL0407]